ncbi:MAG: LacI family DNA-binding transcriptional regulator [Phycisphaerales bacterium]
MTKQGTTVRDIASVAGVSAASVSRALRNPESVSDRTRTLVRGALEQIEVSRSGIAPSVVSTIGCLFVDSTSGPRFHGFDATIWGGLARVAIRHGAEVLLMNVDQRNNHESVAEMIHRRGIKALAIRCDAGSDELLDDIANAGIPTIAVAHKHDHPKIGYVCVSSRESSRDAVDHLAKLGHKQIAFCRNIVDDQDHADRGAGYHDGLKLHGIEYDPSMVITTPANADGGVTAINRLLALPKPPTAIYFADPLPTIGALRRLHELGISVPDEISIAGFDDDDARTLGCPVYTAVCQSAPALAEMTGQLLCRMMHGNGISEPPRIELDSYLEVNATTGRAPTRG